MKKMAIQFTLKLFALAGFITIFLLINSIITGSLPIASGVILLFATTILSLNFAYFALFTPMKSTKKKTAASSMKKNVSYYKNVKPSNPSFSSNVA